MGGRSPPVFDILDSPSRNATMDSYSTHDMLLKSARALVRRRVRGRVNALRLDKRRGMDDQVGRL